VPTNTTCFEIARFLSFTMANFEKKRIGAQDTNKFDYNIKNLNDKTPLDYINDQRVNNLMIKTLFNKIDVLEKELDTFKKQDISVYINELTFYQFLKIKFNKFYDRFKIQIFVVLIGIVSIFYVSQT
jgi:hypothetical protein